MPRAPVPGGLARGEETDQAVGRRPLRRVRVEQEPLTVSARLGERGRELIERPVVELGRHFHEAGHTELRCPSR